MHRFCGKKVQGRSVTETLKRKICQVALCFSQCCRTLAPKATRSPAVFLAIQLLGGVYLIYLGVNSLRSSGTADLKPDIDTSSHNAALRGFMVAFLNPKLAIFMLALFSQFLSPEAKVLEKGVMVATVGVTDACWYSLIVTLVSRKAFLKRLQHSAVLIDRVFGVLLIVLALNVLLRALLQI
ncbi:MAG TPA: LysE family translocator [Halieaceae bacterium]|nr:MAG: hypothetical protein DRQ98_02820 [Gammaproteobacteria bacterium]HDY83019.1 LysE family translocator [Halieaceae bacterium]